MTKKRIGLDGLNLNLQTQQPIPAMSVFLALIALIVMAAYVDEVHRLANGHGRYLGHCGFYIGVEVLSHLLGGEPEN